MSGLGVEWHPHGVLSVWVCGVWLCKYVGSPWGGMGGVRMACHRCRWEGGKGRYGVRRPSIGVHPQHRHCHKAHKHNGRPLCFFTCSSPLHEGLSDPSNTDRMKCFLSIGEGRNGSCSLHEQRLRPWRMVGVGHGLGVCLVDPVSVLS